MGDVGKDMKDPRRQKESGESEGAAIQNKEEAQKVGCRGEHGEVQAGVQEEGRKSARV